MAPRFAGDDEVNTKQLKLSLALTLAGAPPAQAIAAPTAAVPMAQPAEPPIGATGPATFDIAGLKLGMGPDAIRQTLGRAGYRVERTSNESDFRNMVASKAAWIRRQQYNATETALRSINAVGPAGERLEIQFAQWPAGPRASYIVYFGNKDRQTVEALKSQVLAKFGQPSWRSGSSPKWCAVEDPCGPLDRPRRPTLSAEFYSWMLVLQTGPEVSEAYDALVEREVRKLAPLNDKSNF